MWKLSLSLVSFLVIVKVACAQSDTKIVQLAQGPVRGYKNPQREFYSYVNIPYATAPTGRNRYKAPLPPPVWTEPFDESDKVIACLQYYQDEFDVTLPNLSIQEDCLVANVYVPDTNATDLAVLVYIHVGAYQILLGQPFTFSAFIRSEKVIVVSFNHRLGPHGFLCLGTEDVPGNAGMKDQVALLRWVQQNIASFGGNPNDVTIHGCSSGGGSTDLHIISPMSAGLFAKAIPESGSVFGATGTQMDPIENAKIFARYLNFTNVDDLDALEEFYKTASDELLVSGFNFIFEKSEDSSIIFAPCVERDTGTGEEIFLDDAPINYLMKNAYNKVPLLVGFADMEGLYRLPDFNSYKDRMNDNFSEFLPAELQFESQTQREEVTARIKNYYFGNKNVSEDNILAFIDYFGDVLFIYPLLRGADMRISNGDIMYLYELAFVDDNTPIIPYAGIRGADHCDQLVTLSDPDTPLIIQSNSEEFKAFKEKMVAYWLNFILTGNPNSENSSLPAWPAVNGKNAPYMTLNTTMSLETASLLGERVRFWDSIYEQHYRLPIPPSRESVPDSASLTTISFLLITVTLALNYIV